MKGVKLVGEEWQGVVGIEWVKVSGSVSGLVRIREQGVREWLVVE